MPMGITRVADQYGFLPEAERHREYLAAQEAEARQIAAAHHGARIHAGTNDPRGRFAAAQRLAAQDTPDYIRREFGDQRAYDKAERQRRDGDTPVEPYVSDEEDARNHFESHVHTAGCDCDDEPESDPNDGFGGKKAPPFGSKERESARIYAHADDPTYPVFQASTHYAEDLTGTTPAPATGIGYGGGTDLGSAAGATLNDGSIANPNPLGTSAGSPALSGTVI